MSPASRRVLPVLIVLVLGLLPVRAHADPPPLQFTFGEGQLGGPRGLSILGNEIFVLEYGTTRVSVFDLEGNFRRSWGTQGEGDGELFQPNRILATPAGEVYISDFVRHDIQVFDLEGTYLRKWGGAGSADSQLNYPYGMDVDAAGNIWVADRGNQVIKQFTPQGVHLLTIDTSEVNGCTDIVVTSDTVYGSMWGHTFGGVRRWDLAGTFIGQSTASFQRSEGIAAAPGGDLYVAAGAPVHRMYAVEPEDLTLITDWGGYGTDDSQLQAPADVAVSAAGVVYVAESNGGRVKAFSYTTAVEHTTWGRIKRTYR